MIIRHLRHNEIDKALWDQKIIGSKNGTIYAMSWYLDIVSPDWEALFSDDVNFVMPLPVKSKYGFRYLTQPFLTQQLGVFSKENLNANLITDFVKAIPYKFFRLKFNSGNLNGQDKMYLKPNFILNLNTTYKLISSQYSQNCNRNLKKADKTNQKIVQNENKDKFWEFIKNNLNFKYPEGLMPVLKNILDETEKNGSAEIWSVFKEDTEDILAAVLFLIWENRAYYLMPASSIEGKKNQAMSLIVDKFIQKNTSKNLILDFEGSSIEGVARFYKGFGAIAEYYPILNRNELIFPFNKILK
jgi:hypothetical protein